MQDRLITGEKTPEQIQAMRDGGKKLAQIFQDIRDYIHAGMSEKDIDAFVDGKIKEYGASATYKTDEVNFPGVICISTNDEIVHSPASDYIFQKGDVVSFDLVITYKNMKTGSAGAAAPVSAATPGIRNARPRPSRSAADGREYSCAESQPLSRGISPLRSDK